MRKNIFLILIFVMCFLFIPNKVRAVEGYEDIKYNKDVRKADDKCLAAGTCIKMCEWENLRPNDSEPYHIYAYYMLNDNSWKYVWFSPLGSNNPRILKSATIPTNKIFYQDNALKYGLSSEGKCPAGAYVDVNSSVGNGILNFIVGGVSTSPIGGMVGEATGNEGLKDFKLDLCFDDKMVDANEKTTCHRKSNTGVKFEGTSSNSYKVTDAIDNYFENSILTVKGISCNSIATNYVVDADKVQKNLLDKFATDYMKDMLHDYRMPSWMHSSYEEKMEIYKSEVNTRVSHCNKSLKSQAITALKNGKITQEEYDQLDGKAAIVESTVKERLEQLENNVSNGIHPSDPNYKPIDPDIVAKTEASCKTLLGEKTLGYLKTGLTLIQIAGAVLAVVLGMSDFMGAVISGDNDANKKASKRLMTRILLAGLLFLIPTLIKFVLGTFGLRDDSICVL